MATLGRKRLILCCDGTWMDSDDGFQKPTLIPYVPTGTLQIPSNVTRISRALRKTGLDGVNQIIFYHAGVGTGSSMLDSVTGGLLGAGISENIREVYSFIAANYVFGDEIILVGFSRGAFTARSVAGMIRDIGILTREGMSDFYPIFKDQENFRNHDYHDIFPTIPFPNKPRGEGRAREYRRRLEQDGLTRLHDEEGNKIHVQAVAVWDTVGSLGIPQLSIFAKLGFPQSTKEFKFYDTNLYGCIKHAFQCLALDEHRAPFQAAVWERTDMQKTTVDLRQIWVPGAHSNAGGGYDDQEIANISLAWMMDQLASIGVAFQDDYIDTIFNHNVQYYLDPPARPTRLLSRRPRQQWAIDSVYQKHKPVRPWGLGKIWNSEVGIYRLTGAGWRTPGFNMRADPDTGKKTNIPMTHTNERIHSSVRIRLDLEGLGLDDVGLYKCPALLKKGWNLRQMRLKVDDPIPWNATWGPSAPAPDIPPDDLRWVWEWDGPEDEAPLERIMVEERLGPYERKLLLLNKGAKYRKGFNRRRKRRTTGEADAEKGDFVQGDDGQGNINPEVLAAGAPSRDPEKQRRERRRRHREPRSDEESLIIDSRRNSEKPVRRRRKRHDGGGETFIIADRSKSRTRMKPAIIVEPAPGPPPLIVDSRRRRKQGRYRDDEIVVIEDHDRPRPSSRPPPPPAMTSRSTPRPPSTDPSQRKYTMEDIIFTPAPGRSQPGSRAASRPPPPPPLFEARRSGSGPQYPVEDEIVVEEEHVREPRRKNRGYERREYPIVEDISIVETSRVRGASRPPPPPPSGFSSNPGVGAERKGYRREKSESVSGISASDSGFDERETRDGNLKGMKDRDREVHRAYVRRDGDRDPIRDRDE